MIQKVLLDRPASEVPIIYVEGLCDNDLIVMHNDRGGLAVRDKLHIINGQHYWLSLLDGSSHWGGPFVTLNGAIGHVIGLGCTVCKLDSKEDLIEWLKERR